MKSLVIYYSRTGTTAKVAKELSRELGSHIERIECTRYNGGWLRYLLAGYDSVKGRLPGIKGPEISFSSFDLVVLGAPIWTSYPALPLRSFLARNPDLPKRVGLFFTCGGHSPPQKAFDFVSDMLPEPIVGSLAIPQSKVTNGQFDGEVSDFARRLLATSP